MYGLANFRRDRDPGGAVASARHSQGLVGTDSVARLSKALTEIRKAAEANVIRSREIPRRDTWYVREIEKGTSVEELINREDSPRIVELLTMNAGAAVGNRRFEAA